MSSSRPEPGARAPLSPHLQPLSRSSSSLLGEGRGQRPELRKSASSTVWQAQPGEASTSPQAPEEEGYPAESMEPAQASSPRPQPGAGGHWRSSTVGNVSTMGSGDLCHLRATGGTAVQRSHSDLVHSIQMRGHGSARKASLSCMALGSSPVHRAQLQPGDSSDQGGQFPVDLERDPAPEDGTSNSAWMLGESQVGVLSPDLGGTTTCSSSLQPEPKATGQSATTSCRALPPAALFCSMSKEGAGSCCHALPATGILAFPKLVASVSESGLQAQHGVKFHCKLPGGVPGHSYCCAHRWDPTGLATEPGSRTKDVWTMTSASDLAPAVASPPSAQDAGVQAAPVASCKDVATSPSMEAPVALHMFPEVTLGSSLEEAPSPVRDVRWDAEGMTWEVYGASVDPEVLGVAIQKHLEMQFEQLQRAPTSEDSLSAEGRRGPLRAVMQSLRRPSCCGCSSTAPE
ncbi:G protein-regulated inducer of neurite outgrowth 2 [Microcebus murinus]|uniref:G protein-regulated inducer of neurite outgrowth 2 n=1 Tax=Microcebus murinus TaxID=30608 RepID=UPI000643BA23|nr:G protein-regulated inducer of neurite outgrowth 2 isoform X2 [Microcebus murinus]XP_012643503.1 G protein-regulated inducer of neurite outgrowth 2 isoform X2 [Microcebus murinus]XP_012643504.1 G protein-regulated inducer of neurite outgrowth 2 isoform X2 [Microcebus murinus]XP_012643505.1 G protein-regulated inducer of neurite outgrowth 2 isoform X2 [Microcebus murinus]XP_012643506.1 G protein-regulated inducer of neurite outgrowth 2 isoform X2 [Microcebus murinus]XP_020136184.1 G protein-